MNFDGGNHFLCVKLLVLLMIVVLLLLPFAIHRGPGLQEQAEQLVKNYLASKGSYMAVYFSEIDTAFSLLEGDSVYRRLGQQARGYQDSTFMFATVDMNKANYYFAQYKLINERRDSTRTHYKPQPIGYLLIHHFQFDGEPWTDSFILDFGLKNFIRIRQTIE
jgi:hypothetical protein